MVRPDGGTRALPRRPVELAGRRCRVPRWSPDRAATRRGEARTRRSALAGAEGDAGPGEIAAALAREAVAVRPGTVPRSLISREPGARAGRAGTRGSVVLLERVLAEPLPGRRAAGKGALRRCLVLRAPRLRCGVPRPGLGTGERRGAGGSAHGHARIGPVARASETRCAVRARRAAPWAVRRKGRTCWREGHPGKAGSSPLAGAGPAAALIAVLPRASAGLRPGDGVGLRLTAPPP
jgi:hypothetical protein